MPNATLSTGLSSLDEFLGGGWARGGLSELRGTPGAGKTSLALRSAGPLTKEKKRIAFVSSNAHLFPPGVGESVDLRFFLWIHPSREERGRWAAEQLIRSGLFPLVIVQDLCCSERFARRLQLSAEASGACVIWLSSLASKSLLWPFFLQGEVGRLSKTDLRFHILRSRKMLPSLTMEVSLYETSNARHPLSLPAQRSVI